MRCAHSFILVALSLLPLPCAGQEAAVEPFVFGEVHPIRSTALEQDRVLNVYLPDGYSPDSAARYPVIFVLDGSYNEDFPHIAGLAQFMNMYDLLPKCIVVGIANNGMSRYHDFTHATKGDSDLVWIPTGGGSDAFINYIADEVLPYMDRTLKTNGTRTIIGQSLGGLLANEILFKRPELFDNYVLVSPSLWWDNGSLAAQAEAWAKANSKARKRVFLAMAHDDDWMKKQGESEVAAFEANTQAPFKWHYEYFDKESHATILHRAVYAAFEWMGKE